MQLGVHDDNLHNVLAKNHILNDRTWGHLWTMILIMNQKRVKQLTMTLRDEDADMQLLPWIDTEEFNPGYMLRSLHLMPKRGNKADWQHTQDYWAEKDTLPTVNLDDKLFVYK